MTPPPHSFTAHDLALIAVSTALGAAVTKAIDWALNLSGAKNSREARIDAKWEAYVEQQNSQRAADKEEISSLRASYNEQVQLSNRLIHQLDEMRTEIDALRAQGDAKDALIKNQEETIDRLRKSQDQAAAAHAKAIKDEDNTIRTLQSAKAEAQAQAADMEKRLRAEIDRLQGEIDLLKAQISPAAVAAVTA